MTDLPPARLAAPARRRWLLPALILVLIAIAIGGWYWWGSGSPHTETPSAKAAKGSGKGGGKGGRFGGGAGGVQPVAAGPARGGGVNVVQTSIRTVTAPRTPTVRARGDR